MSKNYHMVQYVFPPHTMPTNIELRTVIYEAMETYIKAGKSVMNGTRFDYDASRSSLPWSDYRDSHCSNRFIDEDTNTLITARPWKDQPQVFYRIFLDEDAANEFINLVKEYGALLARIITEDQVTPERDGHKIPAGVFVPEEHVAKFVWPGQPTFEYTGTYPEPGPADASPYPAA